MLSLARNKIFSVLALILFSMQSFGMTVSYHYCKGELFSVNLYGQPEKCEMANHQKSNESQIHPCCKKRLEKLERLKSKGPQIKSLCCSDKTVEFNTGDVDSKVTKINSSNIDDLDICSEIFHFKSPVPFVYPQVTLHNGDPPLKSQSRLVLYQVFRI